MKPHHYLAIGLRIFAILLFVYVFRQSMQQFTLLTSGSLHVANILIMPLLVTLLSLIAAIACWLFPITIAKNVIKPELDKEIQPLNYTSFLTVVILAIGLFLTFKAISDIVYWLTYLNIVPSGAYDSEAKALMLATVVETVVAFALIGRARTIAHYLLRITK